jgi:NAD(P)-dependent dehydrogenase (short-subunit alcohol dehydrogenase family)
VAPQPPIRSFDGAVALVTGAGRGLGRGIALQLAEQGCSVVINYARDSGAAEEAAEACRQVARSSSQEFITVQADIRAKDARKHLLERTLAHFGRLDALVNNAGMAPRSRADILVASEDSFDEIIRTNLQGPYFLTQLVAAHWLGAGAAPARSEGRKIIFITSISADTASTHRGDYCVSKAGLSMAAQLWATRLAAEGIQVVEVRPGIMATDMTAGVRDKYDALLSAGLVPQMRWGTPEDVGRAVRSVIAGDFPFSTGAVIPVDGGFNLRRL